MATTSDYLTQLQADKQTLVDNLVAKGVEATSDETFTSLVPKVLDVSGDVSEYLNTEITSTTSNVILGTIKKLPDIIYSGTSTNANLSCQELFRGCKKLEKMPNVDLKTNRISNARSFFSGCESIIDISNFLKLDTTYLSQCDYMFDNCKLLQEIPIFYTGYCTNFSGMFNSCLSLLEIPQIDTSKGTNFYDFIYSSSSVYSFKLKKIPLLDFSSAINISNMFYGQASAYGRLTDIGGFKDLGKAYTQKSANFGGYTLNLSSCKNLTHDSLMNVINNLYDLNLTYDVANGGTLYTQKLVLGSTNIAKLTAEEIAIATNKGWTVS